MRTTRLGNAVLETLALAIVPLAPAAAQLPLGDPLPVNVTTAGDQQGARIGMAENGRFTVVWSDGIGDGSELFLRNYQADGAPFTVAPLNQFTTGEQSGPEISMNGNGDWVAVWKSVGQNPGSAGDLFARRTGNNGSTIGSELPVNATTAHDACNQEVSRADDDSFVVIWRDGTDGTDVHFRRFAADATPLTGDEVANQIAAENVFDGNVASAPDGSFVATWTGDDEDGHGVFARCFDADGVALGGDFRLNDQAAGAQEGPWVAADARGAFVAVWRDGGLTGHFELRLFHPDCTPRSGDLPLDEVLLTGKRFDIHVDMASDGAFVVAWDDESGAGDRGVHAREFTRSGTPVGEPFAVPVDAAGVQGGATVGIGAGLFAVAWTDQEGTSGINDDVFVRRYQRRVVFTDDFESEDFFYWSETAP